MIVPIATDALLLLKFIYYIYYYVYGLVSFFLLLVFPWHLYLNNPLTVIAGMGFEGGACSKGHCPRSFPAYCYPPKEGGVWVCISHIVYMMFIAGGASVYQIYCEDWQTYLSSLR